MPLKYLNVILEVSSQSVTVYPILFQNTVAVSIDLFLFLLLLYKLNGFVTVLKSELTWVVSSIEGKKVISLDRPD